MIKHLLNNKIVLGVFTLVLIISFGCKKKDTDVITDQKEVVKLIEPTSSLVGTWKLLKYEEDYYSQPNCATGFPNTRLLKDGDVFQMKIKSNGLVSSFYNDSLVETFFLTDKTSNQNNNFFSSHINNSNSIFMIEPTSKLITNLSLGDSIICENRSFYDFHQDINFRKIIYSQLYTKVSN